MSTSGTATFALTAAGLINEAYERCGVLGAGQQLDPNLFTSALNSLNIIAKSLPTKHHCLSSRKLREYTLQTSDQVLYPVIGGVSYTCIKTHKPSTSTTPGTGSLWKTCWVLDDTSVPGATGWDVTTEEYKSSASLELDADVIDVETVCVTSDSFQDYPCGIIGYNEYLTYLLGSKRTTTALPTHIVVHKQLSEITLFFYPLPNVSTYTVKVLCLVRVQDMSAADDDLDVPVEFTEYLVNQLVAILCMKHGMPDLAPMYEQRGMALLREIKSLDTEENDSIIVRGTY